MGNKKSLFKKKNVKKRAISLIVLMISIVIMIILATTAVVLVNNSGIFGAGAELDFKNDVSQYNEKVKEKMGYITSSTQSGTIVSGDEMISYVPEINDKYKDKLFILDGKLVLDGAKASKNEIKWANEIGVDVSTYVDISGLELEIGENDIIIKKVNLIGKDSEIKSYKFKIDGNDWITSNKGEYTFANLEVGKYYDIYVSLVLKDGSESREYKKHVKTDVVGDVVSIILSTQNWTKNALNVKLSYTNDLMDGYKIQYKISSSNWTDYTESIDKAGGFSVDENTTIYARLYNDSKKRETANNFIEIRNIDKTKPTAPTSIEVTSGINSLKVRASGAQDDLSGVAGYIYSIDGTKYTTLVKSNEEYTFTDIKANTNKVVYVKAVDSVGNESDAYSKDWSTWDAEEKVRMIPSETNWTNKDVTIALAHQSIPTDYIMQYKIGENGTWQNGYTILIKENVDIVYARLYNAKLDDTIGLNSMSVKNIDRLPPEMNKDVDYNPTKNSIITSNLKGIDRGGSGISHYELFIRKHGESNYKSYTTKENTYTFEGLVKDTLYDIRIRVYDNAGNVSDFVENSIPTVCTITLDSQGADSTKEGTKAIYEKYNKGLYDTEDCINEITSIEIPQKGEYTFDGYYTQTGGKGTKMIDENGNITSNFNNKYYTSAGTLYASWKSYTITYNFSENGGTECTKTSEMVKAGKTLDLTQGPTATKSGWKFIGWNTEVDKRAKLNSIVMERKNIVLYAQYSKDVTATCNYYGGTSAVTGTMWNKEKSISIKLPQISNATKDGVTYTKRGWAKEDTANANIVVNSGANVTLSDNLTYYANYQSSININIYYCSGDGTNSSSLGNTVDVATASSGRYMNYKGNFVYTSVTLPDVVKNSKGFCGTDYSGISKEKNSTTAATLDTSSTTYYAFYTKDVTLYYYNGSKHTSSVVKRNVTTDATKYTSKEGSTIPTPASYDGATFKGWSCRPNVVDARYFNATAVAVLYAYYQKTITVSYDKNDGIGTIAPASGPKTYISKAVSTDTSVALTTLNPSITVSDGSGFTRTGYVFSGWNTKADGTGKNYAKSEKAEFSESTTLYAKWTAIGYNISYNLQNGTAGTNKPATAKYDQVVTISNPTKTVTITGDPNDTGATITGSPAKKPQTFAGWTYSGGNTATALYGTASNAVTTSWNNASTKVIAGYFKNLTATNNATVTMKANWTTAAITLPKATKTGYTVKWYKNTAGTGTAYGSGSSYSPAEGDPANITFYAKATANKYQVIYNNGDANSGTLPSNQDVYYDGKVTLGTNNMEKNNTSGYTVTYVKGTATGGTLPGVQNQVVSYTHNGWAKLKNGSRVYINGETISPYKIDGDLNLYPSWTATRGTITLATNNMTKSNENMGKITFNYNGNGQANTTAYAYTQYTANGWVDDDKKTYTNGKIITPSSNLTLEPNFTSTAKSPTFPTPTRNGYVFDGWYDSTGKKYASYDGEADITVYAHWTAIGYNISYNLQNGTAGTNKPTTAKYDQVVTISNPTKTVTITGDPNDTGATITGSPAKKPQTFAGWTYSGGNTATALYGTASNAVTTSWNNASTKVIAGYFKNLTATNNATVTMKANWTTAAITLPKATKTGYTVKWYKNPAGTGTAYDGSESSYSPAAGDPANITFYAKATAKKYQVIYNNGDANSGTLPSNQDVYYDGKVTLGTNNMEKNNTSGYTVTYVKGTATGGTLPGVQNQVVSYTHNGWAKLKNGSRVYINGETISPYKIDGDLNLYPSWTATRGTITLATNNMTKSNKNRGKITFNYNGNGQASTTAYAYTQYTANGWVDDDTTYYTNGKVITPSSNLTLEPNFNSLVKSPTFPTPKRTGYVFDGWYDGTGSSAKKYTSYYGEEDITLYAHWTKVYYQNTSSKKYYVTLNDAFSDAASGNIINVIDNATETKSATLASGKTVTLNMNSRNITFNGAYGITNNGTLSMQGSGTITGSSAHVVHNVGVLNIATCTITNTTNGSTRAIWNDYTGTVNMSSGTVSNTVTSTNMESNTTTPYAVANGGTFNLKDGTIASNSSGKDLQYGVYTTGTFNMSGGKIETCGTAIYMANKKDTTTNGGTNITGGTIRNTSTGRVAVQNVSNGTLTISGNNTISITSTASKGIYLTGPGKVNITAPNLTVSGDTNAISNKDTGTITISGAATFTATKYACVENEGTGSISIGAGTFNGKTYGINNKSTGTITVTGGTIEASGGTGISVGGGTLTLGKDDSSVSTTNPSITGSSIGIEGGSIKAFNFYDGVIISEGSYGSSMHTTATKTPTNYTVQKDDNGKKAYLRKNRSTLTIDPNGGSVKVWNPSGATSYTTVTSSRPYTNSYDSKIKLSVPTKKNASDTENYTVTYDYAGATGGNSTKTSSSAKTTVTKYTFNSWSGQGATAAPITKDTENGTTYYYYTFPKTEAATSNYIATYSQTQTSTYSSVTLPTPTKTGYTFGGWYTESGTKAGAGGASYTPKGSLTLHASWTINKSTLTINPAGGSVKVWSPSSTSSPVTITSNTSYKQNYNTTLLCSATKGNTTSPTNYTVTYNYNGGSGSTTSATAKKTVTTSYTFDSWTKSSTFYGTTSNIGNNQTLYTFPSNNNVTSTLTAKYTSTSSTVNGIVTLPSTNTRSGYTFQGWYTAASGGTRVGGAGSSYTVKSNTTLYAHWSNNSHTHSSGGNELLTAIPAGGNYKNYVVRNYHWSGTWTCTAGHTHTSSTSKQGYYIACIYCGKSFYDLGMPASDGRWWCPIDANSKTGLNLPTN